MSMRNWYHCLHGRLEVFLVDRHLYSDVRQGSINLWVRFWADGGVILGICIVLLCGPETEVRRKFSCTPQHTPRADKREGSQYGKYCHYLKSIELK